MKSMSGVISIFVPLEIPIRDKLRLSGALGLNVSCKEKPEDFSMKWIFFSKIRLSLK